MHQVPNTVHFEFMLNLTDRSVVVFATRDAFLHPNFQCKSQFSSVIVKNQRASVPQTIFPFHLILNFFPFKNHFYFTSLDGKRNIKKIQISITSWYIKKKNLHKNILYCLLMLPFCTFYCNESTLKKFVLIPILFAVFLFLFLAVIIMRSLAVVQDEMRWIFLDGVWGTLLKRLLIVFALFCTIYSRKSFLLRFWSCFRFQTFMKQVKTIQQTKKMLKSVNGYFQILLKTNPADIQKTSSNLSTFHFALHLKLFQMADFHPLIKCLLMKENALKIVHREKKSHNTQ